MVKRATALAGTHLCTRLQGLAHKVAGLSHGIGQ